VLSERSYSLRPTLTPSNDDPLDFVEADLVTATIIELSGLGGRVRRHGARGLQLAAIAEIGGDPGRAEAMAIDRA